MKWEDDTFGLVLRMRQMVYSSKDFESLWFLRPVGSKPAQLERLTKAEGLPKNISIEEFLDEPSGKAERCAKHGVDFPTFDKWYRKTHKKVYPIAVTGMPAEEEAEILSEAAKVSEESKVHDPVRHPFKYPTNRVASINKKISISIKFPDGMKISKTGISFTELKHLIERLEVVC